VRCSARSIRGRRSTCSLLTCGNSCIQRNDTMFRMTGFHFCKNKLVTTSPLCAFKLLLKCLGARSSNPLLPKALEALLRPCTVDIISIDYVSVEALVLVCGMSHNGQWQVWGGCARVVSHETEECTSSATNFKPMSSSYDMQPENGLINTLILWPI